MLKLMFRPVTGVKGTLWNGTDGPNLRVLFTGEKVSRVSQHAGPVW